MFVVQEAEQSIVLELGRFLRVENRPELHFKLPFIQGVRNFERRVLDFEVGLGEIPTSDQKPTLVDTYARCRIIEPLMFMQTGRVDLATCSSLARQFRIQARGRCPGHHQAEQRRMETQRRQEAIRIRAEGDKEAQTIHAETDKQARVIQAEAQQKANILRGEGESMA